MTLFVVLVKKGIVPGLLVVPIAKCWIEREVCGESGLEFSSFEKVITPFKKGEGLMVNYGC